MANDGKSLLMFGCFDTKEEDFAFLYNCLQSHNEPVVTMNIGILGTTSNFPVDIEADEVAAEAGHTLAEIRGKRDRGYAVGVMGAGAAKVVARLISDNKIKGAIAMGGGGGTFMALTAMQSIPIGIPKLCLSTLAGKDVSRLLGNKDITLLPSVVDVAGINSISAPLIKHAAAAICAMSSVDTSYTQRNLGRIAISMFGNTSKCVDKCTELLKKRGFEVFAFHANGVGGRAMESLIREGCFSAVLDVTTTELADELCGGICSAGPERLQAAVESNIPQVVVPGCLDMVNFGQVDTIPPKYSGREFYSWAPDVTLMRTNDAENLILGETLSSKLNRSSVPVTILIPRKGISQIDAADGIFYRPETDHVLFNAIKQHVNNNIDVIEVDAHINDEQFAVTLVEELLAVMRRFNGYAPKEDVFY